MKLDELKVMKEEYLLKVKENGLEALKEEINTFLKLNPQVTMVSWTQYVPTFNDGDPCEFTVGDARIKLEKDSLKEHLDSFEAEEIEESWEDYNSETSWDDNHGHDSYDIKSDALSKALAQLNYKFSHVEDVLKVNYGVNVRVIVTKDKVLVEDHYGSY